MSGMFEVTMSVMVSQPVRQRRARRGRRERMGWEI
jgi:hypothetical protein